MSNDETTLDPKNVLEINSDVDIATLHLNAREGFLFSQVDGAMTVGDLKIISNMTGKEFSTAMDKLLQMEVLKIAGKSEQPSAKPARPKVQTNETLSFEDKVRNMYMNLENLNYYELLLVSRNAPPEEIKQAYYRMTKEFHPDNFFRGDDQEIRDRLQSIFAQVNEAYKLLTNGRMRREYDSTLDEYEETETSPNAFRESSEDTSSGSAPDAKPRPRKPPTPPPKAQMKNPFMDNVLKAKRLYEGAVTEMKKKNHSAARQNLRIAQSLDPYNKRYVELLIKLDKLESVEQAETYYQTATEHEKQGRLKEAAKLYRESMLLDDSNPLYYTLLARVTFEQDGKNSDIAKKLLKKAIEFNSNDPETYLLLGNIFKKDNQLPAAIAQFAKGIEKHPGHRELSKQLKRAKKGK